MAGLSAFEAAIVNAGIGFAHSRLIAKVGDTLEDGASFVGSLIGLSSGTPKQRLTQLKQNIKTLQQQQPTVNALIAVLGEAKAAIVAMGNAIGAGGVNGAVQAANQLHTLLTKIDKAIEHVATLAASLPKDQAVFNAVNNISNPFVAIIADPADATGKAVAQGLDAFFKALLGWKNVTTELAKALKWDKASKSLTAELTSLPATTTPKLPGFGFDGAKLEAFLIIPTQVKAGLRLSGQLKPGLRADTMMKSIIPGQAETQATTPVAITLDTFDGLTLGQGPDQRIILPLRFSLPGFELRELAISQPKDDRIDVTAVMAAKIGQLLAVVAEGAGASLLPAGPEPKRPDGIGIRISAGPVTGGGYLRYLESTQEYGGVAELAFGVIDLHAMAILKSTPTLSFVALIGARFLPKVELGFGFTLNGVGGILAHNRDVSIDALSAGLKDGIVSNLLFPADPVANAPTILNQLASVFPEKPGGFAIGPMFELGWGSQAEIVRARIGIIIAPTNPQFVVLGAVSIKVPPDPPGNGPKPPKIVDLNLDMLAVFSASQFYLRAALHHSTIAGQAVNGDLGFFVRWSGSAQFAISAGGFFPGYKGPSELADLRRLSIPIKPPFNLLTINATGYFALLTNSVQVGGQIDLVARLDPARGEAYFGLDALFEWAPKLHFKFDVRAGIKLSFFGETVCGVSFRGSLEGTSPWRLQGYASVSVLCWDIDFDLGPFVWGEDAQATKKIKIVDAVVAALTSPEAWSSRSSRTGQYRLRATAAGVVLIEPGSVVTARQSLLPFDTHFDRVGAFPTDEHELSFANPRFGNLAAGKTGHATAQFAPGQFLDLKPDQQLSRPAFEMLPAGVEMAVTDGAALGDAAERALTWETILIEPQPKAKGLKWAVAGQVTWDLSPLGAALAHGSPVARARRATSPYDVVGPKPVGIGVKPAGLKQVSAIETRGARPSAAMPTSAAAQLVEQRGGATAGMQMRAAGVSA